MKNTGCGFLDINTLFCFQLLEKNMLFYNCGDGTGTTCKPLQSTAELPFISTKS